MVLLFDELSLHIVIHILPHIHIRYRASVYLWQYEILALNKKQKKSSVNRRILAIIEHF